MSIKIFRVKSGAVNILYSRQALLRDVNSLRSHNLRYVLTSLSMTLKCYEVYIGDEFKSMYSVKF